MNNETPRERFVREARSGSARKNVTTEEVFKALAIYRDKRDPPCGGACRSAGRSHTVRPSPPRGGVLPR